MGASRDANWRAMKTATRISGFTVVIFSCQAVADDRVANSSAAFCFAELCFVAPLEWPSREARSNSRPPLGLLRANNCGAA